jgi:hypothetical protein
VNPAMKWRQARIAVLARQVQLSIRRRRGIGSMYVPPIAETISDLHSTRSDGFVCPPMSVDQDDYADRERWWL